MVRRRVLSGLAAAVLAGQGEAWAQASKARHANDSVMGPFLKTIFDRLDQTLASMPALGGYLAGLVQQFDQRLTGLLIGIVIAGLLAEWLVHLVLERTRLGIFERHAGESPLRAFFHGALLDFVALLALWIAARLVVAQVGDPRSVPGQIAHQILLALMFWRGFNFVFRIWLRPNASVGRIAPVDDAAAGRLLVALNLVVLLPVLARVLARALMITGASPEVTAAAVMLFVPILAAGVVYVIWHWRLDMAAWLTAMVPEHGISRKLKLDMARNWWMAGLVFYVFMGLVAIYAALTERATASLGLEAIESALLFLLLFETLMHRLTRHIVSELPMAGDVVADCVRLVVRLFLLIMIVDDLLVRVLGAFTPEEWVEHDRGAKIAAVSAVAIYAFWRFLRYRMDSYIAANPLPSADVAADSEEEVVVAASRLRTLMPLLRVVAGVSIAVIGGLLVLSELGVNITPLIAGASVFGLAVSFGSQSLVRDIVSGVFFLAEDSFRIGEYVDCSKVKGVVEGFSVRSLKLRHQNGQLHIVPFGQVAHITNFSRDWTVVKFNLAFANGTDVELLRKTVKKIGLQMMEEPQFKPILMQPLKMQGVVDIKDSQLIVRFKFMTKPKNPTMIQRMAIRRMYDTLPALGIQFARPVYQFPIPATPDAPPAAAAANPLKAAE